MKLENPTVQKTVKSGKSETPRTSLSLYKQVADSPNQHIRALFNEKGSKLSDYQIIGEWMETTSPNQMVEKLLYQSAKDLGYLKKPTA